MIITIIIITLYIVHLILSIIISGIFGGYNMYNTTYSNHSNAVVGVRFHQSHQLILLSGVVSFHSFPPSINTGTVKL